MNKSKHDTNFSYTIEIAFDKVVHDDDDVNVQSISST